MRAEEITYVAFSILLIVCGIRWLKKPKGELPNVETPKLEGWRKLFTTSTPSQALSIFNLSHHSLTATVDAIIISVR
jgi:hypothetical protein